MNNINWNHRVLIHENEGEIYFKIHEVYYKDEIPFDYTIDPVIIESEKIKEIKWMLNKIQEAIKKPILWAGENFPNECKMKYTCDLCGRDKFDKPIPHNCNNNFRKRGLSFTQNYY